MQYLTLEKESGAIQAVNMGLIGEEVEFPVMDYAGVTEWVKDKLRLKDLGYEDFKIRIPKPTIEDLREGDVISFTIVTLSRVSSYVKIVDERLKIRLKELLDLKQLRRLKLITRKSEGVDVLEGTK